MKFLLNFFNSPSKKQTNSPSKKQTNSPSSDINNSIENIQKSLEDLSNELKNTDKQILDIKQECKNKLKELTEYEKKFYFLRIKNFEEKKDCLEINIRKLELMLQKLNIALA